MTVPAELTDRRFESTEIGHRDASGLSSRFNEVNKSR